MNCDNPLIMLGEYLSVLSTEYWLLKHYGLQGTEDFLAVKNEIYYALQAIDRLDGTAERYFDPTVNTLEYNGFLRREDSNFDRLTRVNSYYRVKEGYLQGYIQQADMNVRRQNNLNFSLVKYDTISLFLRAKTLYFVLTT
jgi:hypothetical protein